ncbi:peptidoglycan-binding protein [Roseibium denhamense]|uniref:Peptidoglycan-binding (PGRP) domain of peptidoglycan hydrolases-containing protein n=2 Tax=Roseibium denhamense TaxID=76305 RepID=A0ABY1N5S2_9HYPH|nr:peptidoglycan-binding protein [Roseibium denhamense]SMP00940.1 Peptidoglycan-binding (PGRP) domain of peptidoglycan hydrolases-containing protein [Roseibium denhamense]
MMGRAGTAARDNPVAAGGTVVMGLTACLIIANAIGLQPGRHPAPLFVTRDRLDAAAVPEPSDRVMQPEIQEISTLVLDVQIALRKLSLYEGPLDGVRGPATERAVRAFERKAGQIETGKVTEALLALILMHRDVPAEADVPVPRSKPSVSGTAAAVTTRESNAPVDTDPRLKQIQMVLADLGYGPLDVDGVMGANTAAAIKRFEFDRGLPLTGAPGAKTIERLEMVSGQRITN